MGNLCGKESSSKDNFTGPGRVVGSAPPPNPNARSSLPSSQKPKVTGQGRTLGAAGDSTSGGGGSDPRSAAAAAAEARNNKAPTGDLARKLEAQKKQTQSQTLQQAAEENRLRRGADEVAESRNYN